MKVEFENAVRLNKSIGASVLLDRIPWGLKGVGKQEVYVGMRPLWSISRQQYIILRNEIHLGIESYCHLMFVCHHLSDAWYASFGVSVHPPSAVSISLFIHMKVILCFHRQKCKRTVRCLFVSQEQQRTRKMQSSQIFNFSNLNAKIEPCLGSLDCFPISSSTQTNWIFMQPAQLFWWHSGLDSL